MTTATSCPAPEKLQDLLANRLPAAEADAVRRHLADCPACMSRVRGPSPSIPFPFLSAPRGEGEIGRIDQHRILGMLGSGGMAYVFDAEDTDLHRREALKVLKPELCDPVTRERFLREARLIAGLPHEHIVTVYQVGQVKGVPYLSMERLEGESLENRVNRDKWLPLAEALSLTREAAEGLVVAHANGLVHRDIKPSNLWLETRNGRFFRVKLIDFGVARSLVQDSHLTSPGTVLGTPNYMAPEQAAGLPLDGRADLYALGCVMYRMLTGQTPFDATTNDTIAVLRAAVKGDAPRISQVVPQLNPAVAELIQQLLARDPAGRPASAADLVERLRALEKDPTDQAAVAPPTQKGSGLTRRPNLIGIGIGIVALIAALVVGAVAAFQRLRAVD